MFDQGKGSTRRSSGGAPADAALETLTARSRGRGARAAAGAPAGALALLALMLAATLAACGSSESGSSATGAIPLKAGESPANQQLYSKRHGGVLTVYQEADFEHLDPGSTYSTQDYTVMAATQRPLYSYPPNTATHLQPDVAAGPPLISDGGRTVTVHIRRHIYFSPPVNREVSSGDVAYAIERGANPNVACPYFSLYFKNLLGAAKASGGPISGIETPNRETIVFHLTKPSATILVGALSLPLSAPVPPEFAKPLDAHHPSTYGTEYLVATGPYMLKSDATGRFLGIGYEQGKAATLVRNPNWNPHTDYRAAYLDEVRINIGGEKTVIGQQVLKGENVLENEPPAQAIVKEAYEHYPHQITFTSGSGTYYAALNNAHGPFTNADLRRAVWAALDRNTLVKVRGGALVAAPMTHFIYPEVAGFEAAGGFAGPKLDYNEHPEGDMTVAAKYMRLAGYPSGRYTGSKTLQVVGVTGEPEAGTAQIVNQALQSLGFKTHLSLVAKAVMYEKYCGVPSQEIDVCPNAGWTRDFDDPLTVLYVPFYGPAISPSGNANWGQVNDPQINAAMERAELIDGEPARARAWAKIDEQLVQQAAAAPGVFVTQGNIEGRTVAGVNQLWNNGAWDYDFTSLK